MVNIKMEKQNVKFSISSVINHLLSYRDPELMRNRGDLKNIRKLDPIMITLARKVRIPLSDLHEGFKYLDAFNKIYTEENIQLYATELHAMMILSLCPSIKHKKYKQYALQLNNLGQNSKAHTGKDLIVLDYVNTAITCCAINGYSKLSLDNEHHRSSFATSVEATFSHEVYHLMDKGWIHGKVKFVEDYHKKSNGVVDLNEFLDLYSLYFQIENIAWSSTINFSDRSDIKEYGRKLRCFSNATYLNQIYSMIKSKQPAKLLGIEFKISDI